MFLNVGFRWIRSKGSFGAEVLKCVELLITRVGLFMVFFFSRWEAIFWQAEKSCTRATYHVFSFKFRCVPIRPKRTLLQRTSLPPHPPPHPCLCCVHRTNKSTRSLQYPLNISSSCWHETTIIIILDTTTSSARQHVIFEEQRRGSHCTRHQKQSFC